MKIVMVLPDLDAGGAQRTFANLASQFLDLGVDIHLIVLKGSGPAADWIKDGVRLTNLHAGRTRNAVPSLAKVLRKESPALIFSTMIDANIVTWIASWFMRPRPKLVLRETNSQRARADLGMMQRVLIGYAYRSADLVVSLSKGVASELIVDCRLPAGKVITIGNPVDVKRWQTGDRRDGKTQHPRIVAAGRLTRQKNFPLLLNAIAKMQTSADLVILGEGADLSDLQALARRLGISERVEFAGLVKDPLPWFSSADIFALSSEWEGFGHVIVEAMSAGLPVVATDCPHGPRDIIANGENGLLVPNNDPQELALALDRLVDDEALRRRLTESGLQTSQRYDSSRIAKKYLEAFGEDRT